MANKREIFRQFKTLGITVQEDVLNCSVDMCGRLFIDEKEIVEAWMAYTLSHLNGAKPTVELLLQMEQKEFGEKLFTTPKRQINDLSSFMETKSNKEYDDEFSTPKRIKSSQDSACQFSPGISQVGTPSSKYSQRSNSGELQTNFNRSIVDWQSDTLPLEIFSYQTSSDWMSLHGTLLDENKILQDSTKDIIDSIVAKHGLNYGVGEQSNSSSSDGNEENGETEASGSTSTEKLIFAGRIVSTESAKLCLNNIVVQDPDHGETKVDMTGVSEFSLFPGQVIVYKGNKTGRKIIAEEVYTTSSLRTSEKALTLTAPLQIVVAAGPFTQSDSLVYEPLRDLIKYVKTHKPHLLILVGPIIDSSHCDVISGTMVEEFSKFYKKVISEIQESIQGTHTKLYIVCSSKDATNSPVYPTKSSTADYCKDISLPDPVMLNINGFIMGLTCTDILMHLGKKEISNGGNRLARLAGHIMHQKNFYPLYPPDMEVGMDLNLWRQHAQLSICPHLLVIPSDLHNFAKAVENVVVVNPGKLVKGSVGGNFACIEVQPENWFQNWSPQTHIAVKVLKI